MSDKELHTMSEVWKHLESGGKVCDRCWAPEEYVTLKDGRLVDERDIYSNELESSNLPYFKYEEPKPKVKKKFYRRKWAYYPGSRLIVAATSWYESIEEFDKAWGEGRILSTEIETMEIEMEREP